jgi:hypothetical protein
MEFTIEEAQFILDQIGRQGVPFGHPNGQHILAVGDSVVAKLMAIIQKENIDNGTFQSLCEQ